jgi:hypothetical protein
VVPDYEAQFTPLVAPDPLTVNYRVQFRGLTNGGSGQPQIFAQEDKSLRNDFTASFSARGRHDVKAGFEAFGTHHWGYVCQNCVGTIDAQGGPLPSNAAEFFPDLYDASTWRLDLIPTSIIRRFQQAIGPINEDLPRWDLGLWLQEDWTLTPRLVLNLGVRYDRANRAFANDTEILPFLPGGRADDTNNWAPRLGFAYSVTPETVIRGGVGKYFAESPAVFSLRTVRAGHLAVVVINNDGRPDFAINPYNGPPPQTYDEALAIVERQGLQRAITGLVPNPSVVSYSYQGSIGFQHQLRGTTGVQMDYVYRGIRDDLTERNLNLAYNPATGVNYPNNDLSHLPYPQFSSVTQLFPDGYGNYHALETGVIKRMSDNWQASATYTLAFFRDGYTSPAPHVPNLAPDLGPQYGLAVTDQRHRAVFNGIWQMPYGLQLSGIYFFGSGERLATVCGCDLRRGAGDDRLLPDGTLVPRNSFVGEPIHRVDVRLLKRLALGSRLRVDALLDVFNAFNHANYGAYIAETSNANFGQPTQSPGLAYAPRMLQIGFRASF